MEKKTSLALELKGVSKQFGGIHALKDVSFGIKKGTVHALVGENGAGKSTLMKILSGIYSKDTGETIIDGKSINISSFAHSQSLGIALVPQELSLVQEFSIAENIFLGNEPKWYGTSIINQKELNKRARKLLESLDIKLDPKEKIMDLSVSDQQMVVIAKSLSQNAKILILDEPTARLGHHEIEHLLDYIIHLKSQGITIIYISHHFEELFKISDEITVLRDGQTIATKRTKDVTKDDLIRMMVNRDFNSFFSKANRTVGDEILQVENLSRKGIVNNVSFSVKKGEILGISGLVGAGRTEMVRTLLGVDKKDSGKVLLEGKEMNFRSLRDSIKSGLVLVPEERRKQGIVSDLSVQSNVSLGSLEMLSRGTIINKSKEKVVVKDLIKKLQVRTSGPDQLVGNLSGGNQQKVVLAKWISRPVKIFFLDEPTRGIDIGAKGEIYKLIEDLAANGTSIVMVSSEIPELQAICDRIIVMKDGHNVAELQKNEFEADTILAHAMGEI